MAEITAALVKDLRERTGAGMMECKKALVAANGDIGEAEVWLRKQGIASAGKKATRATKQGLIGTYIHPGGQLGVMVEVNCESDFVARTDDFQGNGARCRDAHRRGRSPVPSQGRRARDVLEKEQEIARARAAARGQARERFSTRSSKAAWRSSTKRCACYEQPFVKEAPSPSSSCQDQNRQARREHFGLALRPLQSGRVAAIEAGQSSRREAPAARSNGRLQAHPA